MNEVLDSTNYNFDNLNIKYYRDYDLQGNFTHEVTNGLILNTGISYFFHNALKDKNEFIPEQGDYMFKKRYADFVPYIRLTFTPNQYYRYIGRRKIYLETNRPTFSLEYAKGISNVFASNSSFNKMELDIHQRIPFNVLRSLSYRVGAGAFFRQKDEYFVNFRNFQRSNYPSSWSDPIGGVFNLLDNRWYYSSPQYVQLHLMYDSPFLLLHFFKSISKYVLSERLYFSQLYTPEKPSYTELGYGIGNYIFNVAGFVSFHKYKVNEFGFRFTFELDKYW